MNRLIQFYLKETRGFTMLITGFYILFNIMGVISKNSGHLAFLGITILSIIMIIYLIKFNLYDTGKETFTLVSMTDSSPTEILLAKLIVSYILILLIVIVECFFILLYEVYIYNYIISSWEGLFMIPVRSLFLTTLAICYISYFTIWIKSFSINKTWRKVLTSGVVIIWVMINGIIRNNIIIFSTDTVQSGRHFGSVRMVIWSVMWHLAWCIIFFFITAYLQKKKIDQI